MEMISFEERQKELCLLASFVSEQEQWLASVLGQLKWSKTSLQNENESALIQCPVNEHHYVPATSREAHKTSCYRASKGVDSAGVDQSQSLVVDKDTLYKDVHVPSVEIDERVARAVRIIASDPLLYQERAPVASVSVAVSTDNVEDTIVSGLDTASLTPHQVISYIKSWKKVPMDWRSVVPGSLDVSQLKGWLFHNLSTEHAHSATIGGEIIAVDSIIQCLTQESQSITPNAMVDRLRPLLRANVSSFVLSLWKHFHISRTLAEGGVAVGVVEDIAPMHLTQLLTLRGATQTEQEEIPQVYKNIMEVVDGADPLPDETPPLPTDAVFYNSTPIERRVRYDYIVGAWRVKVPKKKKTIDPDLYRNDEAALKAKLKAEAQAGLSKEGGDSQSFHEVLRERKEKRDYKRRRQKYRAKNVHVTRRKTSEIFRDIINNRMEEIVETLTPHFINEVTEQAPKPDQESETVQLLEKPSSRHTEQGDIRERSEHRESSRKRRRTSRSRSRSKSRERRRSHKKHKKHKSHKHSSSREH